MTRFDMMTPGRNTPEPDPIDRMVNAGLVFAWIAALIGLCVMAIWISLWAINKPVHPSACDQLRSECTAVTQERLSQ